MSVYSVFANAFVSTYNHPTLLCNLRNPFVIWSIGAIVPSMYFDSDIKIAKQISSHLALVRSIQK